MVRAKEKLVGAYAFLFGIVLAVALGLFQSKLTAMTTAFYSLLVIIGLIVGFLNSVDKNTNTFLIASLSLVIVGGLGNNTLMFISNLSPILSSLSNILSALLVLFIPATIIVALKTVFSIASV